MNRLPNREKYEIYDQSVLEKFTEKENINLEKEVFLKGNPFLYNSSNEEIGVNSIEEYKVVFRKQERTFEEVIHDSNLSKFTKKRFVRKTLKNWKKDYLKTRDKTIEKNLGVSEFIGEIKTLKFNKLIRFWLIFILLLLLFISVLNTDKYLYDFKSEILYKINIVLIDCFLRYKFVRIINYISICLLIITLLYSIFYNIVFKDFKVFYDTSKKVLSNFQYHLARDYKKKYSKVKKYYLQGLNRKKYLIPYDIKLVGEGKTNLKMFEDISSLTVAKVRRFKNNKIFYIIIKYILVISSILLTLIEIVYLVYQIIKNLLF